MNDLDGKLTYRFSRTSPVLAGSALVNLASFNLHGGRGSSSVWASKDGQSWTLLLDNPVPAGVDSYRTFDAPLPTEVLGGRDVWLQVRLSTSGTPLDSYSTAQFSRSSSLATEDVFAVRLSGAGVASEDADDDGLPDAWELLTGVNDPDADDDGDGINNRQEFASGLDPRVYNPDAVVGNFNERNPTASPLAQALAGDRRGYLHFFPEATAGTFEWLVQGQFYGGAVGEPPAPAGPPVPYEAPAGAYLYFAMGESIETAEVLLLDPNNPLDSDNDLLDDRWEQHYGLTDPAGDADGDGLSNLTEFRRGGNPLGFDRAPALVGDTAPLRWSPDAPDLKMRWSDSRGRWEWTGEFAAGPVAFKFAMGPGWTGDNHGRAAVDGRTDTSGGPESNIIADLPTTGRYRFAFNELSATYSIELLPRHAEWREQHDLPADRSWDADTDGDGLSDLLEYALGKDPNQQDFNPNAWRAEPTPGKSPRLTTTQHDWIYSWIQNNDPQLEIVPLLCPELSASEWFETTSEVAGDQSDTPDGHTRKTVRLPGDTPQMFLRLRVRLVP